jgi:hypothetical protein
MENAHMLSRMRLGVLIFISLAMQSVTLSSLLSSELSILYIVWVISHIPSACADFTTATVWKSTYKTVHYNPPHWMGCPISFIWYTNAELSKLFQSNETVYTLFRQFITIYISSVLPNTSFRRFTIRSNGCRCSSHSPQRVMVSFVTCVRLANAFRICCHSSEMHLSNTSQVICLLMLVKSFAMSIISLKASMWFVGYVTVVASLLWKFQDSLCCRSTGCIWI